MLGTLEVQGDANLDWGPLFGLLPLPALCWAPVANCSDAPTSGPSSEKCMVSICQVQVSIFHGMRTLHFFPGWLQNMWLYRGLNSCQDSGPVCLMEPYRTIYLQLPSTRYSQLLTPLDDPSTRLLQPGTSVISSVDLPPPLRIGQRQEGHMGDDAASR